MRRSPCSALILAVVALSAATGLAACGSSGGGGSSGTKTIALNLYSREIPYFQQIVQGIQHSADALGWKVDVTYGNNDPTQQVNQVENALTTQPDAMVVVPIDENAIVPAFQQAKQAGIPTMSVSDNIAPSARSDQLTFIGVNYVDLAKLKAQLIVKTLHGHGTVGYIHGIRGLSFSEDQVKGAMPVLNNASGITVADGPYAGAFSSDKGLTATEDLLNGTPNINAIYFDNDDLALGGIQAINEKGLGGKVFTVGTDGGPAAIDAVKKGQLDATYSLCGYAIGTKTVQVLKQYLDNGVKPPATINTQPLLFTPQNVNQELAKVNSGQC